VGLWVRCVCAASVFPGSGRVPDGRDSRIRGYRYSAGVGSWETCISCLRGMSSVLLPQILLSRGFAPYRFRGTGGFRNVGPDGMFLLSGYHKSPQTLHPFPRVLDNFSSLEGLRCFAGRGKTRLFTQKIRFTGDTPIVLNGRQSNLFCFRAFDRAFADNSRQLWSLFFHLSEIYFQHDLIERYR